MFGKVIPFYSLLKPSGAVSPPLDAYPGATAAYSVRLLSSSYTGNCIRVRRSSDSTEQDIGFVDNYIDTASMLTFCGSGSGFVTTWYDQSGNARNATQTTATQQPRIVNAGVLETVNGKASLAFDGTDDRMKITAFQFTSDNYNSFVGKRSVSAQRIYGLAADTSSPPAYLWGLWFDNKYYLQASTNAYQVGPTGTTDTSTAQLLLTGLKSGLTMSMYKNSTTIASTRTSLSLATNIGYIGAYANTQFANGWLQEIIYYNNDQLSNRSGIETNINSFYGIY